MGKSLTRKIIESHYVSGSMTPGEEVFIKVDQTLTHDINAVMTYLAFEAIGLDRIRTECSVSYLDHNLLYVDNKTPDDHIYLQSAAKRFGVHVSRPGNGICHAVHVARFGVPGKVSMGGDSHTPHGGAVDDVLIYKFADDHYMLIVNAGNTDKDFAWLSEHAFGDVQVINNSAKWGQLALQGPLHQAVLDAAGFEGELPQKYYTFNDKMTVAGISCLISRTGYTGEDGVELYCAAEDTVRLFEALLEAGKGVDMLPCGLGARDTLRFEASMPLYGHEMSADINPVECGLGFAIKFNKPDFIGKEALLKPQTRKRIGLKIVGKGIARPDADVLCNGEKVGIVTSGGPAPAVGGNYAMALVSADADENGTWAVSVRGRVIDCEFAPMPFYKRK